MTLHSNDDYRRSSDPSAAAMLFSHYLGFAEWLIGHNRSKDLIWIQHHSLGEITQGT